MIRYSRIGVLLLIAITLLCGAVSAVQAQADLELTKTLHTGGPIFAGDQIIWNITLTNSGDADATGIVVTDDTTGLGDFTLDKVEASDGTTFDEATNEWAIGSLAGNGASATLNLTMTIADDAVAGELKNCVAITTPAPALDTEPVCATAVIAAEIAADLELTKTLYTGGAIFAGNQIIWNITLTNSGPDATDIVVTDDKTGLGEFTLDKVEASDGTSFNAGNFEWNIESLTSGTSATLNLTMTIADDAVVGELENCVEITTSTPAQDTERVCASGEISPTVKLDVTIKPETLNLKSRGVFTVFIRFSEETTDFDFGDLSSLECNGAKPTRMQITQKDGGTLMAKYRRQDLVDVVAGEQVTITCEVTISTDGGDVKFAGTDTLRVIGEKKKGLDAFFAGILDTILPLEDDGGEVAEDQTTTTVQPTATPQDSLNRGQLKKAERNSDTPCTENCNAADSQDTRGNGKKAGTDDQNSVTGSSGKENQGNGNGNTADTGNGNGNGKGNSNKPDTEKGNGNNKK